MLCGDATDLTINVDGQISASTVSTLPLEQKKKTKKSPAFPSRLQIPDPLPVQLVGMDGAPGEPFGLECATKQIPRRK